MRKEHPFDFAKWDDFLTKIEGQTVRWEVGVGTQGHPQYDPQMFDLAREFEWSDYYDQNYDRTLKQYDHSELAEEQISELARTSDNFRDLRAITSVVIHGERRLEGMWAAMTEKGILRQLLRRLQALTPDDFPEQY
ncbi:hypothetical protein ESZ50_07170 [Weissella muntiaci]|uniref:Uncharacterized protein n=1 Tax=Weissella muntiaci TaxID=2508881 RepID=A0A6C2C4W1_9LACO|nr:DUF6508 domain-containing protein [Weissella muntiaci]TYC49020.1 hypothetical protein ESZ50_07170 [Weissella muntiaci]